MSIVRSQITGHRSQVTNHKNMHSHFAKALVAIMLFLAGAAGNVWGQFLLPYGTHEPTYYYWDDWYDTSHDFLNSFLYFRNVSRSGAPIFLHKMYTDRPLKVKGVAIVSTGFFDVCTIDTVPDRIIPEYVQLYDALPTGCTLLAEKQWSPSNLTHLMEIRCDNITLTANTYEAEFDSVFELTDSFYVGTTMYCNIHYVLGTYPNERHYYPYRIFQIASIKNDGSKTANPSLYKYRCTKMDYNSFDTTHWYYIDDKHSWPMIFPVIDTTRTCFPASELTATPLENASAALTWSSASSPQAWDIAYGHTGCSPSARSSQRVATPYVTLSNLDTNTWYTAYVRAVCDIGDYSYWSDSVTFYIPGSNDTSLVDVGIVEQLTHLMPNPAAQQLTIASSFGVRLVELYALDGKLLDKIPLDGSPVHYLDVSAYPAGSYIVRITTSQGPIAKKLLIAHP